MWINPRYLADDEESFAAIRHNPLATLITTDPLRVAHMPVLLEEPRERRHLVGHVPRIDPFSHALSQPTPILVIFSGPSAYVSPAWYDPVGRLPTYNFVVVHVTGQLEPMSDDELREHLMELIDVHERTQRHTDCQLWEPGDAALERMDILLPRIAGFTVHIDSVEGKFKLSEEGSTADACSVRNALAGSPRTADRAVADMMDSLAVGFGSAIEV